MSNKRDRYETFFPLFHNGFYTEIVYNIKYRIKVVLALFAGTLAEPELVTAAGAGKVPLWEGNEEEMARLCGLR